MSTRVAIIGPTGYTGLYLIQLLLGHPSAEMTYLASYREKLPDIMDEFPQLRGRLSDQIAQCRPIDYDAIAQEADVAFLCLPHRVAMQYVPPLLDAGVRVIDLSADYRMKDPHLYERVYGHAHEDCENLGEAVYGLPELVDEASLRGAMLVANPGCYPTAAGLAVAPLLSRSLIKPANIIINAASGVTGAGRSPASHLHFAEQNEGFMPYGAIGGHRHQSEIEQILSQAIGQTTPVLFVPHLLPLDRGILTTTYLEPADPDVSQDDLLDAFEDAYGNQPFIRLIDGLPNVKHVRDTNFCDLTVRLIPARKDSPARVVVFSAIDNMIKGASGQAVQNMNIVFGENQTAGLL